MKTLKQIMGDLGGYQPKPEGEQNFVKKHVVDKKEDMNGNGDDVFKAAKVKTADRPGERHGYTDADDDKVHGDTEWAKILKKYKVIGEESLMVSRHHNYARPGQGPEKHTITRDHGEAPDGSRVYSVKQPNGYHGVLAVKGNTVVGSSQNNLSKDQAHSLGAHYAKHGAVGIGVGTNWSLGSGIHGKVVREEVELEEKHLTPAELRKREEVAQAIERDKPGMAMKKKMAIATAAAKRVAEEVVVEAKEEKKTAKGKAVMPATGVYDSIPLGITVSEESGSSIDTSLLELFVALDEEERALFIEMLESDGDLLREIAEETK